MLMDTLRDTISRHHITEFTLRLDGEAGQIDVATVVALLNGLSSLIQEVNTELDTHRKIAFKLDAARHGGLLLHLSLHESLTGALAGYFTGNNVKVAPQIIKTVIDLFELRKKLGGETVLEAQTVATADGGTQFLLRTEQGTVPAEAKTFKIYQNNAAVHSAINRIAGAIKADASITDFSLFKERSSKGDALFNLERLYIGGFSTPPATVEPETRVEFDYGVPVSVVKISFEVGLKWEVLYRGERIFVSIGDSAFLAKVDGGQAFSKGDILRVNLANDQQFDNALGGFLNKGHRIIEVLEHQRRPEQGVLDFG